MMKPVLTLVASAALMTGLAAAPAAAKSDNAARVYSGGCSGFLPTTGGLNSGIPLTGTGHKVINSGGVTNVVCHFDVDKSRRPARVVRAVEFDCRNSTDGSITYDTMMMVNQAGRGLLVCRFRN